MITGLLWLEINDVRPLAQSVALAAVAYRRKFDVVPNVCYVHPSALADGDGCQVPGVRVMGKANVLKRHFWVGVEQEGERSENDDGNQP